MVAIDAVGRLTGVDVVEASDRIFVESSLEAVKKSTYLPAVRNGRPVACRALLPIRFSLTD
jgi:protein TonB